MTKEQLSEGASGAFFFRTDDERLFVSELGAAYVTLANSHTSRATSLHASYVYGATRLPRLRGRTAAFRATSVVLA